MKKYLILLLAIFMIILSSCKENSPIMVHIIPQPESVKVLEGQFIVNSETKLIVDSEESFLAAEYLADQIALYSNIKLISYKLDEIDRSKNSIRLIIDQNGSDLGEEGYKLDVEDESIIIKANNAKGLFWGIQTLTQLFPADFYSEQVRLTTLSIPNIRIKDTPRFKYRGMHLDVCRHMFPVEFIKKYIDLLAMYKFNTFHWHLTEDQGWRIEIKRYPKLAEIAAYRDSTLIGHYRNKPHKWDGVRYGGYYTQEEVKEIVHYAAARNITIIPEIEMPGHSLAALAAYPELACTGGPFRPATLWGVFEDVYCPKEETFDFLEGVLTEVMELFPGEYIHIGGDECPKTRWAACDACQQLMKKEGLETEEELQSYFIRRIEKFVNEHGRKLIGWDEILEGGLSPNATVMSWRGTEGGIAASQQGHDAVMTPGSHCYFDHYQADPESQPLAIGGLTTLKKVYHYEPVPEELTDDQAKHILGAQGNVWTEYIPTLEHVEYMILPRMAALAEVNWSRPEKKNWDNFQRRIKHHFKIYEALGLTYYSEIIE